MIELPHHHQWGIHVMWAQLKGGGYLMSTLISPGSCTARTQWDKSMMSYQMIRLAMTILNSLMVQRNNWPPPSSRRSHWIRIRVPHFLRCQGVICFIHLMGCVYILQNKIIYHKDLCILTMIFVDQLETHLSFEYIMCLLATHLIRVAKVNINGRHHIIDDTW